MFEDDDKFHDECGVVGIFQTAKQSADGEKSDEPYSARHFNAVQQVYYALYALQHRGQDSAGIAVSDGTEMRVHKNLGAVSEVFKSEQRK